MNFDDREIFRISDICRIRRGASPRPIQEYMSERGMPWVKISDVTSTESRYVKNTKEFIKEEGVAKSRLVEEGTLILSNSATPGIPKIMKIQACVHDGWLILDDFKSCTKDYMYYLLLNERERLVNLSNGSVFRNLKTDIVKNYLVSLPSVLKQEKITNILTTLDEKIEVNNRINRILENMAQEIFKRWFVDFEFPNEDGEPYKSSGGEMVESELGLIPKGWGVNEFRNLFKFIKGKKPSIIENFKFDNSEKYLTIDVLNRNSELFCNIDKMIHAKSNDILMVMDGASSGTIFYGQEGVVGSTLSKLAITNTMISKSALYYLVKVNEDEIKKHTTGSAIPHTDKEYVYKLKIGLPNNKVILENADRIFDSIMVKNIILENENFMLKQIRETLLPKLMSGDIRVPIKEV